LVSLNGHLRHHGRFYVAALLGVLVYAIMHVALGPVPAAAAGDTFFTVYMIASAYLLLTSTKENLRTRAAVEDEGILIVIVIALATVAFSVVGIFTALNQGHRPDALSLVLVLATAPLSWFMLHAIAAFHYANLYYAGHGKVAAGTALQFPGADEPGLWDFFYFSFVIGMTFQVSDVQVCTAKMRRAVIGHSIISFFFNTVLIAMAVNAAVANAN